MQQIINNSLKKVGSLDLAHKAFLSLFLLNAVMWSGVFERCLADLTTVISFKSSVSLKNAKLKITKQDLICDFSKWEKRKTTQTASFERLAFIVLAPQSGQRLNSDLKDKIKSKSGRGAKGSFLPFNLVLNCGLYLWSNSWSSYQALDLKYKAYSFDFKNSDASFLSYPSAPLRGPPIYIS